MARYFWDRERQTFRPMSERPAPKETPGPQVMRDQAPFTSPVTGETIDGRTQLRDHERRHGVQQVGTDIKGPEPRAD